LAVIVSGCSTADSPILRTALVERELPAVAIVPCAAPVPLPDRRLGERETADLWGRDRTALRTCETRRAAAVAASGGPHAE
jgi:hypothetical protein